MQTVRALTISKRVEAALSRGFKKKLLVEATGLSFNTFQKRLKDNSWENADIQKLEATGVI